MQIFAFPKSESVFFLCLFLGIMFVRFFGSESGRLGHKEQGLGVRGIAKTNLPRTSELSLFQGPFFMISLALGPIFITLGALDAGRDGGFAMIFRCFPMIR
jgi:hypothetical protein